MKEKHLRHLPELTRGEKCLNCEHPLSKEDNFCPRCGQINNTKRVSFMDMVRETLGDFFAYDSRLTNSLIPLFKKPGQLSFDYISGKRASHIHPIRLYFVVSFILFTLLTLNSWREKYFDIDIASEEVSFEFNNQNNADIYTIIGSKEIITQEDIEFAKKSKADTFVLFLLDIKGISTQIGGINLIKCLS